MRAIISQRTVYPNRSQNGHLTLMTVERPGPVTVL